MIATEPSFTPEALPAVTVPVGFTTGLSFPSASAVVSGRGCSSVVNIFGSPFFCGMATGMSSSLKKPAACAFAQRCCVRSANAS